MDLAGGEARQGPTHLWGSVRALVTGKGRGGNAARRGTPPGSGESRHGRSRRGDGGAADRRSISAAPGVSERFLRDTLAHLGGWTGDVREIQRTLAIDEGQHAALTERIKVFADAMSLRPEISRTDGRTHIRLRCQDGGGLTNHDIAFAARIEDAYRAVAVL